VVSEEFFNHQELMFACDIKSLPSRRRSTGTRDCQCGFGSIRGNRAGRNHYDSRYRRWPAFRGLEIGFERPRLSTSNGAEVLINGNAAPILYGSISQWN